MVYNNEIKKWEHAGGPGISQVHVYQNLANNSYRIVGRKAETNEVCNILFYFSVTLVYAKMMISVFQ